MIVSRIPSLQLTDNTSRDKANTPTVDAAYLRSDIAGDRERDIDLIIILIIEIRFDKTKRLVSGAFKPPSMNKTTFKQDNDKVLDKFFNVYEIYKW